MPGDQRWPIFMKPPSALPSAAVAVQSKLQDRTAVWIYWIYQGPGGLLVCSLSILDVSSNCGYRAVTFAQSLQYWFFSAQIHHAVQGGG